MLQMQSKNEKFSHHEALVMKLFSQKALNDGKKSLFLNRA